MPARTQAMGFNTLDTLRNIPMSNPLQRRTPCVKTGSQNFCSGSDLPLPPSLSFPYPLLTPFSPLLPTPFPKSSKGSRESCKFPPASPRLQMHYDVFMALKTHVVAKNPNTPGGGVNPLTPLNAGVPHTSKLYYKWDTRTLIPNTDEESCPK